MPDIASKIADLINDQNTFASTLYLILLDNFGIESLTWHPVVIREQINSIATEPISEHNFQKLLTAVLVSQSDDIYDYPFHLNLYSQILNNKVVSPETIFSIADIYDLSWGLTEARFIKEDDVDTPLNTLLSAANRAYIESALLFHGFLLAPTSLQYKDSLLVIEKDFSSDLPVDLQKSVLKMATEYSSEVDKFIQTKRERLATELSELPLRNGSTLEAVGVLLSR